MKKIIVAVIIALSCISTAIAVRVEVPVKYRTFDLGISMYYQPELAGSGENGSYIEDDEIIIHAGVKDIFLYRMELPEDLLSRHSMDRLMCRPSFHVDEENSRYASDYLGLLYEKLPDGKLRLLSVPSDLDFSDNDMIPYGVFEIPSEIISIGPAVAVGCGVDRIIAIPATLTDIDDYAFIGSGIRGFLVHPDNPRYASIDGSLYDKTERKLLYAAREHNSYSFSVPDGIARIGDYAFLGSEIRTISIPSTIKYVSPLAFTGVIEDGRFSSFVHMISDISMRGESDRLKLIWENIPLSTGEMWNVTYIIADDVLVAALQSVYVDTDGYEAVNEFWGKGEEVFSIEFYHRGFVELDVPDCVREIGPYAFFGIDTETLSIPGSVKVIEGSAFSAAEIDSLKLDEGTERITGYRGDLPFLSEIWLPSSLTEIFGFTPDDAEILVAGYGTEYDRDDLIYDGPSAVSTGDVFHISKDSPFYTYFMAIDPYAVEDISWLGDQG